MQHIISNVWNNEFFPIRKHPKKDTISLRNPIKTTFSSNCLHWAVINDILSGSTKNIQSIKGLSTVATEFIYERK